MCGSAFAEMPTVPAEPALLLKLSSDPASLNLIFWLGVLSTFGFGNRGFSQCRSRDLGSNRSLLSAGARVLNDWPEAFRTALVSWRREPKTQGHLQSINEAWPSLFRTVAWLERQAERDLIWAEISEVVKRIDLSDQPVFGRNPHVLGSAVPVTRVAKQLKRGKGRIRDALEKISPGTSFQRQPRGRRTICVLPPSAVEQVKRYLDDLVSWKPAAKILGLSVDRVKLLCAAGRLSEDNDQLSRQQCQTLAVQIRGVAISATRGQSCETANELLRTLVPARRTDEFLSAMLDGTLALYGEDDGVRPPGQFLMNRESVVDWVSTQRAEVAAVLSVGDAAKRLGAKSEVMYEWADRGLLRTEHGIVGRRPSLVVTADALEEFEGRYALLAPMARQAGIAKKHSYQWALEQGLEVVSGPLIDSSRQYLVERVGKHHFPAWRQAEAPRQCCKPSHLGLAFQPE